MKNKWILFGIAFAFIAINLLNTDFSAFQQLSLADLVSVIAITFVILLLKAGVLSAVLIGLKKLWEKIRSRRSR